MERGGGARGLMDSGVDCGPTPLTINSASHGKLAALTPPASGLLLGNQRPWYVEPCLCDWVIKDLGMSRLSV